MKDRLAGVGTQRGGEQVDVGHHHRRRFEAVRATGRFDGHRGVTGR
jgi:hypothetical protein